MRELESDQRLARAWDSRQQNESTTACPRSFARDLGDRVKCRICGHPRPPDVGELARLHKLSGCFHQARQGPVCLFTKKGIGRDWFARSQVVKFTDEIVDGVEPDYMDAIVFAQSTMRADQHERAVHGAISAVAVVSQ